MATSELRHSGYFKKQHNPHDACSRKVWRTFCFPQAQSIPTPSANLKYNKGQEAQLRCATETTGTASVLGPCNICRSEGLSHTCEIPTRNVGSTPCRRRQQLLLPWQCMLTPDSRSTKKSSSVRRQQQAGIWTWPPSSPTHQGKWTTYLSPAGNQQSSWRSGKHLLLLKYWANRCDQQAAAGHCLDLPWLKVSTNQTLQDPSHKLIFSALWSLSTPSNST